MPDSILPTARVVQWFDLRFVEDGRKVFCPCQVCSRPMWFPPSKAGKYLTCGKECAQKRLDAIKQSRKRSCLTCSAVFFPRQVQLDAGAGKYCCSKCAQHVLESGRTQEARAKSGKTRKESRLAGKFVVLTGKDHPSWKGGKEATKQREAKKDVEIRRKKRRDYLKANPHKNREWINNRRSALHGDKLPGGAIKKIGILQKWKCAVCKNDIKGSYHTDHIEPLSRGGRNIALNIQLLCPSCNVRKAAKDPIAFMQERGFLL